MLPFHLSPPAKDPLRLLCLGAHCDDIEIGCGGTLLKLMRERNTALAVYWLVFSSTPVRAKEAEAAADLFLRGAGAATIDVRDFRDGFFPTRWAEIKEVFETVKKSFSPDLIFTHYRDDRHQDHRIVSDLTWNTFRDHTILEYEIPKYDGDLSTPNVYVHIDRELCTAKTRIILGSFHSQQGKHWFTEDTLKALMRLRGIESAAPDLYAEGFHGRKLVL